MFQENLIKFYWVKSFRNYFNLLNCYPYPSKQITLSSYAAAQIRHSLCRLVAQQVSSPVGAGIFPNPEQKLEFCFAQSFSILDSKTLFLQSLFFFSFVYISFLFCFLWLNQLISSASVLFPGLLACQATMFWPIVAWQPENTAAQAKRADRQTQVAGINWQREKRKLKKDNNNTKRRKMEKKKMSQNQEQKRIEQKKILISAQDTQLLSAY